MFHTTRIRRISASALVAAALAVGAFSVDAPTFPTKPETLVIPFVAAGPTDLWGRALAQSMGATLGQTVIVENRAGAGGTLAPADVARAAKDSDALLLLRHIGLSTGTGLYRKRSFDPLKDF